MKNNYQLKLGTLLSDFVLYKELNRYLNSTIYSKVVMTSVIIRVT